MSPQAKIGRNNIVLSFEDFCDRIDEIFQTIQGIRFPAIRWKIFWGIRKYLNSLNYHGHSVMRS